jgi:hypothetical protein
MYIHTHTQVCARTHIHVCVCVCVYIHTYIHPHTYYLNMGIINKRCEMEPKLRDLETEVTSQITLNYVWDSVWNYLSCCVLHSKIYIICCNIHVLFKAEFELRLWLRKAQYLGTYFKKKHTIINITSRELHNEYDSNFYDLLYVITSVNLRKILVKAYSPMGKLKIKRIPKFGLTF